jgi:hypothetical protein
MTLGYHNVSRFTNNAQLAYMNCSSVLILLGLLPGAPAFSTHSIPSLRHLHIKTHRRKSANFSEQERFVVGTQSKTSHMNRKAGWEEEKGGKGQRRRKKEGKKGRAPVTVMRSRITLLSKVTPRLRLGTRLTRPLPPPDIIIISLLVIDHRSTKTSKCFNQPQSAKVGSYSCCYRLTEEKEKRLRCRYE